jgi:YfiR/HmsC-like
VNAFTAAAVAFLVSMAGTAASQEERAAPREDALKAAYLFNFTKFVDWPETAQDSTLTLCFLGADGVRAALASTLANKHIGAHSLALRELSTSADANGCSVLYVAATAEAARRADLSLPMLTVGDATGFAKEGGIIELFTEGNRLHFIVNVAHAKRAGIRISSSLLQLASVVEKDGE